MEKEILKIYTDNGLAQNPTFHDIEIEDYALDKTRMGTPKLTATLMYSTPLDNEWSQREYVIVEGERYYIRDTPSSSKSNTDARYKHALEFHSERDELLGGILYRDVVPSHAATYDRPCSNSTTVKFYGTIGEYVDRLNCALLEAGVGDSVLRTKTSLTTGDAIVGDGYCAMLDPYGDYDKTTSHEYAFEDKYISEVISEGYGINKVPFEFRDKRIIFGALPVVVSQKFKYGYDNELLSIEKNNAKAKIINRITMLGSSENIPYYYPNETEYGHISIEAAVSNAVLTSEHIQIANMSQMLARMNADSVAVLRKYDEASENGDSSDSGDADSDVNIQRYYTSFNDRPNEEYILNTPITYASGNADTVDWYLTIVFSVPKEGEYICSDFRASVWKINESPSSASMLSTVNYVKLSSRRNQDSTFIKHNSDVSSDGTTINLGYLPKGSYELLIKYVIPNIRTTAFMSCSFAGLKIGGEKEFETFHKTGYYWEVGDKRYDGVGSLGIVLTQAVTDDMIGDSFHWVASGRMPFQTHLMPPIYVDTQGQERFYNAVDNTYTDPETGNKYTFQNPYNEKNPSEYIYRNEKIKPTIEGVKNSQNQFLGVIADIDFDSDDNDALKADSEGEGGKNDSLQYEHSFFYIKLNRFDGAYGFDLLSHYSQTDAMTIQMTSGSCNGCKFKIQVEKYTDESGLERYRNPVQTDGENGHIVGGSYGNKVKKDNAQAWQQNTQTHSIWICVQKDAETFGAIMPNVSNNYLPKAGDTFNIINIDLPQSYIDAAQKRLEDEGIRFMADNNEEKFTFNIKASRIFFAEHPEVLAQLDEYSKIVIEYADVDYELFVNSFSVECKGNESLPDIRIDLTDTIAVGESFVKKVAEQAISMMPTPYNMGGGGLSTSLADKRYLNKYKADRTPYKIASDTGFEVGNFVSGGSGGIFYQDADTGKTWIEADMLKIRMKAIFEELMISKISTVLGENMITPGGSIDISFIEETPTAYRCYFKAKEEDKGAGCQFVVGDQIISQEFNIISGLTQVATNNYYWRLVTAVDNDGAYIELSKTDYASGSGVPRVGDTICQLGNRTDKTRQSAIILSTVDAFAPSVTLYSGIDSYSLTDKSVVEYGVDKTKNPPEPFFHCYGSFFFGPRDKKSYLQFEPSEETLVFKGKLEVTSTIGDQTFAEYITADGKRRIFTSQPTPPYDKGDLWVNATYGTQYSNDLLRCETSKTASETFAIGDWMLASKYTDDALAQEAIDRFGKWASDGVFSPTEIKELALEIERIEGGKASLYDRYNVYQDNNKPNALLTAAKTAYDAAYNAYHGAITSVISATPDNDGCVAVPSDFKEKLQAYYNANAQFEEALTIAAKDYSDGVVASFNYLKEALLQDTIIDGGVVMSSIISLGVTDKDTQQRITRAGLNGIYDATAKGGGIAAWYGGSMIDREVSGNENNANAATSLHRMDGSGYFAKGALSWSTDGLNIGYGNIILGADGSMTLASGIELSGVTGSLGENLESLLNFMVGFQNLIVPVDSSLNTLSYETALKDPTKVYALKATKSFYSEGSISAKGGNSGGSGSGSGGASVLEELNDVRIADASAGQSLVYNGTYWVNQTIDTGLDESALGVYLTSNNYAKKSDIPSLAGYATESWVEGKGYLTSHQPIYALTVQKNGAAVGTYTPNSAAKTINISDVASAATLSSHIGNTTIHITAAERTKWDNTTSALDAIMGSDSDSVINKWNEVVAFLDTYTEADTLANLLSNKADKSQLADYYTKSDSDARYVNAAGDTMTGALTINSNENALSLNSYSPNSWMYFNLNGVNKASTGYYSGLAFVANEVTDARIGINDSGIPQYWSDSVGTNIYTLWHSGNDGSGSGLDADLLDGVHKDSFNAAMCYGTRSMPNGGYYKIKIKSTAAWMLGFKIFAYQDYCFDEIDISGYNYGVNYWHEPSASLVNSQGFNARTSIDVIFGYDSAWNLWVAIPANFYAGITITDVTNGCDQVNKHDLFEIVYEETLTGSIYSIVTAVRHATLSDNVASATKLQTARSIWGQSFDGTANVSGDMTGVGSITASGSITAASASIAFIKLEQNDEINVYDGSRNLNLQYRTSNGISMCIGGGNVGVGTTSPAFKLDVNGDIHTNSSVRIGDATLSWDSANNALKIDKGVYSTSFVSAKGLGVESGGGSGTSYNRLDNWSDYTTDKSSWVLSAKLGYDLYTDAAAMKSRILSLEGGSALNVTTTGSGNAITSISKSGTTITATKGATFLTSHQSLANYYTKSEVDTKNWLSVIDAMYNVDPDRTWENIRTDMRVRFFDVYENGGPGSYGNVMEISGRSGHWQPQLWFDGGTNSSIYYRNKYYNGGYGSWRTLLFDTNYSTYTDTRYYTKSESDGKFLTSINTTGIGNVVIDINGGTATKGYISAFADWADTRSNKTMPNDYDNAFKVIGIKNVDKPNNDLYYSVIGYRGWMDPSGGNAWEIGFANSEIFVRSGESTTWNAWEQLLTSSSSLAWSKLTGRPTTLAGYGITDAYTKSDSDARYVNAAGDTMTGALTINSSNENALSLNSYGASSFMYFSTNGVNKASIGYYRGLSYVGNEVTTARIGVNDSDIPQYWSDYLGTNIYTLWHSGNDGSGSGLDADLLDGVHKDSFNAAMCYGTTAMHDSGYYKIKIKSTASWMLGFKILAYQNYCFDEIDISGYNYGVYYWYSHSASLVNSQGINARTSIDVIFGYDSACNLWVAIPANYYAGITITDVTNGYDQVNKHDLFEIVYEETLTGTVYDRITAVRHATLSDNVASATKLQTARSIWGQSFDGTANVSGDMTGVGSITASGSITAASASIAFIKLEQNDEINVYDGSRNLNLQYRTSNGISMCIGGGNVGVGTTSPAFKLDVNGDIRGHWLRSNGDTGWYSNTYGGGWYMSDSIWIRGYGGKSLFMSNGEIQTLNNFNRRGNRNYAWNEGVGAYNVALPNNRSQTPLLLAYNSAVEATNAAGANRFFAMEILNDGTQLRYNFLGNHRFTMYQDGVFYAAGGITTDGSVTAKASSSSSDSRLKNVVGNVTLPTYVIANAPNVFFNWNDDDTKRRNVGTIAQYWLNALPEVVSEDDKGYYSIAYGNLGVAIGISNSKDLLRHDDEISTLKKRVKELERRNAELETRLQMINY